ncbi:MAG: hypothetical protein JNL43_06100 [Flavobacteriales bacterium]|nr:hypothetical protein [Flavobacteriales bacterium]
MVRPLLGDRSICTSTTTLRTNIERPMAHFRSASFLFALVLSSVALNAQGDRTRIRVRMGMEGEGDARLAPIGLVKTAANSLLMQRQEVEVDGVVKGRLDLYDRAKLGFLRTQPPVEKLTNGRKVVPDRVIVFAGRTMMLARDHGADATSLYYQVLEPNITKMPPPHEVLCSWPVALPSATRAEPASFNYHYSPDSSLLLLRSPMVPMHGGYKAMLGLIGKDMQVRWQQAVTGGEKSIRSMVLDAELDTSGTAYVLVSDRSARAEVADGKPTVSITLHRIGKDSASVVAVPLSREQFLTHAILGQLPDGRLALCGVYAKIEADKVHTEGDMIAVIAPDGTIGEPMLIPHPEEGGLNAEGEPQPVQGQKFTEKDTERWMTGIRMIDVMPRKDGGFFLVKELYFMETYFDLKDKRTMDRYIHGPVQATAVDKSGNAQWNSLFRRWYQSASPTLGNVMCGSFSDELFLFLMDSEEMAGLRRTGGKMAPGLMDGPYSAHVSFDAKGVSKAKPVLKGTGEAGYICGQQLYRIGPGEYYTFGSEKPDGGRYLPVRIDLSTDTK